MKWDDLDILYERWKWDNILGKYIVFLNEDIKRLSDEVLEKDVRDSAVTEPNSEISIKKTDDFTFVNFNFRTID